MTVGAAGPRTAHKVRHVVTSVLRRATGTGGVVLLRADSPEGELLRGWLEQVEIACVVPDSDEVDGMHRALGGPRIEAERAVGRLLAHDTDGALANPANKTQLLFARDLPPERLFPLGDLYQRDVRALAGDASPPALADGATADELDSIDRALISYLERGFDRERSVLECAPAWRAAVAEVFERSAGVYRTGPVVPKLGYRTLGIDP